MLQMHQKKKKKNAFRSQGDIVVLSNMQFQLKDILLYFFLEQLMAGFYRILMLNFLFYT